MKESQAYYSHRPQSLFAPYNSTARIPCQPLTIVGHFRYIKIQLDSEA